MTDRGLSGKNDTPTIAAIAVIAGLTAPLAHEALGHGGVCLALGGQVTLLTSSLFQCSVPSNLIDLGGPLTHLLVGAIALAAGASISLERAGLKLGLILIGAFAGFWEGAYLVQAMAMEHGDLYFAAAAFIGEPSLWWRGAGGVLGLGIYLAIFRLASGQLAAMWPVPTARRVARLCWIAATAAVAVAALTYRGGPGINLRDTILEVGAASMPLLLIQGPQRTAPEGPAASIKRQPAVIAAAAILFIAFVMTLGHGIVGSM